MIYNLKEKRTFNLILFSLFLFVFLISSVAALKIGETKGSGVKIIEKVSDAIGTFLGLSDTPASYVGSGGMCVKVNAGATALEFVACGGGGDFSFTNFQNSFNLNASGLQFNFNQSNLVYNFNQSNLIYNFNQTAGYNLSYLFNQSNLVYNFNQSNFAWQSTYNVTYDQWAFNQSAGSSSSIWNYNQTEAVGRSNITMYPDVVIKYSGGNYIQGFDSRGWYSALT